MATPNIKNLSFNSKARTAVALLTALATVSILDLNLFTAPQPHANRLLQVEDDALAVSSKRIQNELRTADELQGSQTKVKPIMTTFFEPVEGGCCGMTQQGHENLVASWKRAWEGHGWEARVLKANRARRHPSFEALDQKLIEANVSEYDRRCFWRWLAMALDDDPLGGWMSDYDSFPLKLIGEMGLELMSEPGFKTYGGHVPALIHANQQSWEHIVQMMIDNLSPDMDIDFISDMLLLLYLHQHYSAEEMGVTTWEFDLWKTFPYKRVPGQDDPFIDCVLVNNYLGAHLSHKGARTALQVTHTFPKIENEVGKGEYAEFRAQAADVMMKDVVLCQKYAAQIH
jgi:hypothetical protein